MKLTKKEQNNLFIKKMNDLGFEYRPRKYHSTNFKSGKHGTILINTLKGNITRITYAPHPKQTTYRIEDLINEKKEGRTDTKNQKLWDAKNNPDFLKYLADRNIRQSEWIDDWFDDDGYAIFEDIYNNHYADFKKEKNGLK